MEIGRMNRRLDLYRMTESRDGYNAVVLTPTLYGHAWAYIRPDVSMETMEGGRTVSRVMATVWMRYRTDITVRDQMRDGEDVWEIESMTNVDSLGDIMILKCKSQKVTP